MKSSHLKTNLILFATVAASGWLAVGCGKPAEQAPRVAHHKQVATNSVAKTTAPVAKSPAVGTPAYLDAKNGFRDLSFGQNESDFNNLVLVSKDDNRPTTVYTRTGDVLDLEGVPLEKIEYVFFKGQLAKIRLVWTATYPDNTFPSPPSTRIAAQCSKLYGKPRRDLVKKDSIEFGWAGQKVNISLNEFKLKGAGQKAGGTWIIPPSSSGEMILSSIPLMRAVDSYVAEKTAQSLNESQNGL